MYTVRHHHHSQDFLITLLCRQLPPAVPGSHRLGFCPYTFVFPKHHITRLMECVAFMLGFNSIGSSRCIPGFFLSVICALLLLTSIPLGICDVYDLPLATPVSLFSLGRNGITASANQIWEVSLFKVKRMLLKNL